MSKRGALLLVGPLCGLLIFIIGFLAGWRFATALISATATMFVASAGSVVIARLTDKDEEASD